MESLRLKQLLVDCLGPLQQTVLSGKTHPLAGQRKNRDKKAQRGAGFIAEDLPDIYTRVYSASKAKMSRIPAKKKMRETFKDVVE